MKRIAGNNIMEEEKKNIMMKIKKGQVYKSVLNSPGDKNNVWILIERIGRNGTIYASASTDGKTRMYYPETFTVYWELDDTKDATRVVFKVEKGSKDDIVAFLLDVPTRWGYVECYAHVGQHSSASILYAKECKPARPEQYADLKAELENIGYFVKPVRRLVGINS